MLLIQRIHIAFCLILLQFSGTDISAQNADIDILKSINPQNPHSKYWRATSNTAYYVSGAALLGTLAQSYIKPDRDLRKSAYEGIIGVGINIVATNALKIIVNRTRPADKYPGDVYELTSSNGRSFPSGHTSLAFATATSLTLAYKKWYVALPAYLWAGSVGYSRMYLGKHYPTDVLGGALVGAGSTLLSYWLSRKFLGKIDHAK